MDFQKLNGLRTGNIILKPISDNDRQFISEMFKDNLVLKYYIVPKEARQDYKNLVNYWLHDISQGAGFAWIIIEKKQGFFSKDISCGFVAFEFRDSLKNARISYALKLEYRGKGIIAKSVSLIIETLKSLGVTSIEADIEKDNIPSENVVQKLGFTTNKKNALYDPEMMRDGEIRFRHLWKKDLSLKSINLSSVKTGRLALNAPKSELISAINNIATSIKANGQHPELIAKYYYILGRIKFGEGNYEEAQEAFGQCNMVVMNNNLPENHETYYWFAKMKELDGKMGDAKMYYEFALEKCTDDADLVTKDEIHKAITEL